MESRTEGESEAERRIFDAARAVFHEHGFGGARMQEIARRAGVNHSMLHYYFRTKSKLFDAVFRRAAMEVMPPIMAVLRSPGEIMEKLDLFVDSYLEMLRLNPHIPAFVTQELRRNPQALRDMVGEVSGGIVDGLRVEIKRAADQGTIRAIGAEDLLANLLGLCVFPILARPMLQTVFGLEDEAYDGFLAGRNQSVKTFLRQMLQP